MPGKGSGATSGGAGRIAVFFLLLLVLCLALFPWDDGTASADPTAIGFAQPTNTSAPIIPVTGATPQVNILILDEEGKQIGPITDVVVRVSDAGQVDSGENGQLLVQPCPTGQVIRAWAPGHEIATQSCDGRYGTYAIPLTHLEAVDNRNYVWSSAAADCNGCHGNQIPANVQTSASYNEVNEWLRSGHAKVFTSRYFESMYKGTSLSGTMSQRAQPVIIGNDWVPVPPEMSANYHGPGFKLDFPLQAGNCAACHVPTAVTASQESVDLTTLFPNPGGVWGEGVTCDVCHKVFDVALDDHGFPFANRPGVLSFQFLRPNSGIFTVGPFSNVLTMTNGSTSNHRATCSPIFSRSEFCAPCHFGKFGDMFIYNSYGEWRASPYAANSEDPGYRTCQDCHMSHMDVNDTRTVWSQRQACSGNNTQFQNFDHSMMDVGRADLPGTGTDIPRMVQNAADIALNFDSQPTGMNALDVIVGVTNTQAGHKFPTDFPLRHLILEVRAEDRVGTPLVQVGGDRIPNWAGPGPGSPSAYVETLRNAGVQDYSGRPGKAFANILVEEETNLSPGTAYWNETKYAVVDSSNGATSDNRLLPRVTDYSTYSFAMPDAGDVKITVTLMYRYAFYDLLVQKEWFDRPDIVVATIQCQGPPTQPEILRQSCKKIAP